MSTPPHLQYLRFSWADLPPELLEEVAFCLTSDQDDLCSFRCVCQNWRSSIPPPPLILSPIFPLQIPDLSRPPDFLNYRHQSFLVVSTAVYLLRPPLRPSGGPGWLVAVEQTRFDRVRLFHPLTRLPLNTDLPENNFPNIVPSMSAMQVSTGFNLRFDDNISPVLERRPKAFCANKVLMWTKPDYCGMEDTDEQLVVLHNTGDLVCLRLNSQYECCVIGSGQVFKFDDIVIRNGMLLAVDRFGRVYGIEYKRAQATTVFVNFPACRGFGERRKRLLLDSKTNDLYLIVRMHGTRKMTNFKVYKFNSEQYVWELLSSLGDRVLFVSFDTCFFVETRDLPGFPCQNCIVFPKDCFPAYSGTNSPDDTLFRGAEGSEYFEVGVYRYGEGDNFYLISDYAGFSDTLWPPPQWILAEDGAMAHN